MVSWGHRGVSPRQVVLVGTRDVLSAASEQQWFHRGQKQSCIKPKHGLLVLSYAWGVVLSRLAILAALLRGIGGKESDC